MTWIALVVLLLVVGLVLLAIEILVIPGFGLIGVLGCGCILGAGATAWLQLGPVQGVVAFGAGVGLAVAMLWVLPRTSAGRALVLQQSHRGSTAAGTSRVALVGKRGIALTPLRPAGTVELENRTVDVVTDGVYVEAGAQVRVAKVEGARVVVEPVEQEEST